VATCKNPWDIPRSSLWRTAFVPTPRGERCLFQKGVQSTHVGESSKRGPPPNLVETSSPSKKAANLPKDEISLPKKEDPKSFVPKLSAPKNLPKG